MRRSARAVVFALCLQLYPFGHRPSGATARAVNEPLESTVSDNAGRKASEEDISRSPSLNVTEFALRPTSRTLVIVNGSPRGGELAWRSLKLNVLDRYKADLALLAPPPASDLRASTLDRAAKYRWTVPEQSDWALLLDRITGITSTANAPTQFSPCAPLTHTRE
ncbi:hypothetical protein CYMTET_15357 [Cymbomonas tetramitiformis]|uniref:Uncharacterized protein n=1 Tax=Cymbomonas tetramitiformis TaxID=36881 RepID=A0AAE0L981_9CHLO|nr:hypothetical protein CYMTET_15357 [Cymbomonas tetramitiformis]